MKRFISILLVCSLLIGAVPALAVDAGEARAVIGANLTEEQIADVYANFGIARGDVTELRVTNADERKYLEGYVDESIIGTNSISCVYIEVLEEGEGLDVTTSNPQLVYLADVCLGAGDGGDNGREDNRGGTPLRSRARRR